MAGVAPVSPSFQFFDSSGNPLVSGKLYVYLAGSTTPTNTWQDKTQLTLNTNPIILNAAGRCTMWLDDSLTYKFELQNSAGVVQAGYPVDNVPGNASSAVYVNFTQSGTGSVTRTAQDKMREIASPLDKGAVGDGVTNDRTPVVNTWAMTSPTTGVGKSYKIGGTLTLPSTYAVRDYRLVDNNVNGQLFVNLTAASEDTRLLQSEIESLDGTAINLQVEASDFVLIDGNRITGASYGVLSNETASGSNAISKVILTGNYIYSDRADAIEWNNFDGASYDYLAVNNILNTGNGSAIAASGFGFGTSAVNGWILANTGIIHTRSEAIHVESRQTFGVIGNVYVRQTEDYGLFVSAPSSGTAHGLLISNLTAKHTGAKTNFHGFYNILDGNGSLGGHLLSNVRMEGFDRGFDFGGDDELHMIQNGFAVDCNTAVSATDGARVFGRLLAHGTPTLARGSNKCRLPFVASFGGNPTTLFDYVGGTTQAGATWEGCSFISTFVHGGTGTETIAITPFVLPYMMEADVEVLLSSSTNYFRLAARLIWDGTTLTEVNRNRRHNGSFANAAFVDSGGTLAVSVSSATAVSTSARIEVSGRLYYR